MKTPASPVPHVRFASGLVRPQEQLDYWQYSLSNVYEISFPDPIPVASFEGVKEVWLLEDMFLSRRECSSHILQRSSRSIRLDLIDHYKIHFRIGRAAKTVVQTDKNVVSVGAGQCVITDMARPEWVRVDDGTTVVAIIPRGRLDPLMPKSCDLHGAVLTGPAAALLSSHLQALTANLMHLSLEQLPTINAATLELFAAALAPSKSTFARARPAVEATLGRAIKGFISANLQRPDLTVESICSNFRISRATLYRLFAPIGGVAQFIQERRLAAIHSTLRNAVGRPHLSQLAEAYGFQSASHFSRAFRNRFGYSAREFVAGSLPVASIPSIAVHGDYSLADWLHSLH